MAIKTRDEIMEQIKTRIGESTDDATLEFLQDFTDTMDDYELRASEQTQWKTKYEENDKAWRERYKERFFGKQDTGSDGTDDEPEDEPKQLTKFADLFSEK